MNLRGKHTCYSCDKPFNWVITIKDDNIENTASVVDEERGIPTFIGKKKLEIDVNCPLCRNVNRFRGEMK